MREVDGLEKKKREKERKINSAAIALKIAGQGDGPDFGLFTKKYSAAT